LRQPLALIVACTRDGLTMADARHLLRGISTVSASRVIGLVFTLVQVKLTVNYLQPNGYGLLTTATVFISAFGAWTELGLGAVVLRRVSGAKQDLTENVGWMMSISLLLMAPLLVASNGLGWILYHHEPRLVLGIAILSLSLGAMCWSSCYTPVAQSRHQFAWYAAADLGSRMVSLSIVAATVWLEGSIAWFFLAQLVPSLIVLFSMEIWGRRVGRFRPVWNRKAMLGLVREALPMTYIFVVAVLYYTIDGILLSKLSTLEAVASYGLGYKIAGNLTILGHAIAAVMGARFAADAAESAAAFSGTMRSTMRLLLVITVPVATLVWPVAPDIIRLIGSEEMVTGTTRPLSIICIAVAIGMMTLVISSALLNAYLHSFLARLNTATLMFNIALNVVLIPWFGAVGAAVALVLSELCGLISCLVLLSRRYPGFFPMHSVLVLPLCAGAALGAELLFEPVPWIPRILMALAVFVVVAFATRALSPAEVRLVLPRRFRLPRRKLV
jgi:O-antigen/teichoic acid export membrane protein